MEPSSPTPTTLAWENAMKSLRKSLPPKDLKQLQSPIRPEDLVNYVDQWKSSKQGKTRKSVDFMQETVARIQRFSGCIDQLAQGVPDPACLLWGAVRFALTVRVCYSLRTISNDSFIDRSSKTFQKSTIKFAKHWQ